MKVEWNVRGVSHREGGWPKEVDSQVKVSHHYYFVEIILMFQEADQVNRYLKKIEKDDAYLTSALHLANLMEEKVKHTIKSYQL